MEEKGVRDGSSRVRGREIFSLGRGRMERRGNDSVKGRENRRKRRAPESRREITVMEGRRRKAEKECEKRKYRRERIGEERSL